MLMVDPGRMTFPEWWAKFHAPLRQYLSRLLQADEPISPLKNA